VSKLTVGLSSSAASSCRAVWIVAGKDCPKVLLSRPRRVPGRRRSWTSGRGPVPRLLRSSGRGRTRRCFGPVPGPSGCRARGPFARMGTHHPPVRNFREARCNFSAILRLPVSLPALFFTVFPVLPLPPGLGERFRSFLAGQPVLLWFCAIWLFPRRRGRRPRRSS